MDPERIFFDGDCDLCHRMVRFVMARDREGTRFRFAPLSGETFRTADVPEEIRRIVPDSLVVETRSGHFLIRSEALIHVLRRLGGICRIVGVMAGFFPRALCDLGYRLLARFRYRLFPLPDSCPVPGRNASARFDP